jgi:hypothetical protein
VTTDNKVFRLGHFSCFHSHLFRIIKNCLKFELQTSGRTVVFIWLAILIPFHLLLFQNHPESVDAHIFGGCCWAGGGALRSLVHASATNNWSDKVLPANNIILFHSRTVNCQSSITIEFSKHRIIRALVVSLVFVWYRVHCLVRCLWMVVLFWWNIRNFLPHSHHLG